MDARIGAVKAVSVHVLPQSGVAEQGFDLGEVFPVKDARNLALRKDSKALIEPEILPITASNVVASPGVGDFVRCDVDLGLVSNNNRR